MPKPFYSMEEVCEKLGKSQDDVKALVRGGALREFRDAGKVFFKADDVEKLAASSALTKEDSGEILLEAVAEPADEPAGRSGAPTEASGGTSIIGLAPLADEEPEKKKEDTVITASGIGVFDDDELEIDADPMAKTQITTGATDDQVSLEGAGSGSGLLDLAREADDTALGADLLDEISTAAEDEAAEAAPPKPVRAAAAPPPPVTAAAEEEEEEEAAEEPVETGEVVVPVVVATTADPAEGMFAGLLVGSLVLMGLAASVVAGLLQGYVPDYGLYLGDGSMFWFFLGGAVLTLGLFLVAGWFLNKSLAPRRR